jgi:Protein of unknown function (DUF2852)
MSQTASGIFEEGSGADGPFRAHSKKVKSRWSYLEVAAMIGGFIVFWPLGLVALFLKWKNGEMWPGAATSQVPGGPWKMPDMSKWQGRSYGYSSSGNAAFDEYKRTQIARLEEERRKLDEEQKAFREHLWNLRKAKDQAEFDRFMAERNAAPPATEPTA